MADRGALRKGFHDMVQELIDASVAAWPEDSLLPLARTAFKSVSHDDAVLGFQERFGGLVDRLAQKDTSAVREAAKDPLFVGLNIEEKFFGSNEATQNTLWTYVGHLCRFVTMEKMYKHIPKKVLGAVNAAAENLKKALDDGTIDPSAINPMELGQSVMSQFNPDDIAQMMKEMTSNPEAMASMIAQMSSVLGSAGGSSVDLSKLINMK